MTRKELEAKGYHFRVRATPRIGACVTLSHAATLIDVHFASSKVGAMAQARKRATIHFVQERLA